MGGGYEAGLQPGWALNACEVPQRGTDTPRYDTNVAVAELTMT
jgi:hypothetical protein